MRMRLTAMMVGVLVMGTGVARATPSTTYWTPMTVDVQSYGVLHIGADNYFTVFKKAEAGGGDFPTDLGLTIGVLPFKSVVAEIGVDLMESSDNPLYFNAKIAVLEDTLFDGAPTIQVGIFNAGTKKDVTDQNIAYAAIGKTIPGIGRLSAGPYIGNSSVLVEKDGNKDNSGFMVAFDRGFTPVKDKDGNEYNKWVFAADYASGNNALGGGGFGVYHFFTKDICLLTGPVWFNEEAINGDWKWTFQLDINL
ncbi:MAG: hypothetical protein WCN95_12930 [bacterium]